MRNSRNLKIEWRNDIPIGCVELARNRTADMIQHYGNNIRSMSIEVLCASCYLQGVEDAYRAEVRFAREPVDYQI